MCTSCMQREAHGFCVLGAEAQVQRYTCGAGSQRRPGAPPLRERFLLPQSYDSTGRCRGPEDQADYVCATRVGLRFCPHDVASVVPAHLLLNARICPHSHLTNRHAHRLC